MKIYDLLLTNRRAHLIAPSREYLYYQANEQLLTLVPDLTAYANAKDEFSLISMNIVIESIVQFQLISTFFSKQKNSDITKDIKPLFKFNNVAIYCPLFSVSNNLLIGNNMGTNLNLDNDFIDLFETYNFSLFESNMTSLVYVGEDIHTRAYYHYDYHTIYIVNDQGRLDQRICLFDKNIEKPDFRNILERIEPVIQAYYAGNRQEFTNSLYKNKLISEKLYNRYQNYIRRHKK